MLHMLMRVAATVLSAKPGKLRLFPDGGIWKSVDENGNVSLLAGLTSFAGRQGPAISPQQSDYDAFFLTPTEADSLFLTPAEGAAAYDPIGSASSQRAQHETAHHLGIALTSTPPALANSTADQDVLTLSIPAGALAPGASFVAVIAGVQSNPVTTNPTLAAKVKINGVTAASAVLATGATAQTNRPFKATLTVSFRATGTSGAASAVAEINITALAGVIAVPLADVAVNTNNAVTLTIALAHSVANAAVTAQARTAYIAQVE